MSARSNDGEEKVVPLSVVLLTVGVIILGTVAAIWLVAPAMMPQPLYDLVQDFLPRTAVAGSPPLPTPVPTAVSPTTTEAPALLPEMEEADDLPDYFVSAEEAAQHIGGAPERILIPAIDLDAPVDDIGMEPVTVDGQTYYQWQVPHDFLAGWHDNSARLGQVGNTVLNGHHNVHGEVFRDLIDLEVGNLVYLYDDENEYAYEITVKEIMPEHGQPLSVRLENAQWIAPTEDERVTMVTCWPYTDNTHRLVVVAEPITETAIHTDGNGRIPIDGN